MSTEILTAFSGVIAAVVALVSFWLSARVARIQNDASRHAVDADAYRRGVEIYESTIDNLRQEVKDLREEIRSLHKEVGQLRQSNRELLDEISKLGSHSDKGKS